MYQDEPRWELGRVHVFWHENENAKGRAGGFSGLAEPGRVHVSTLYLSQCARTLHELGPDVDTDSAESLKVIRTDTRPNRVRGHNCKQERGPNPTQNRSRRSTGRKGLLHLSVLSPAWLPVLRVVRQDRSVRLFRLFRLWPSDNKAVTGQSHGHGREWHHRALDRRCGRASESCRRRGWNIGL